MAISDWPEAERPRERLLRDGPSALSDAELLAIFLRVGVRGKSAVDLARELLAAFDGDVTRLCSASIEELCKVSGMGPAKAAQLQAVLELARRALRQGLVARDTLGSPGAVRDYLRLRLAHLPHETGSVCEMLWSRPGNWTTGQCRRSRRGHCRTVYRRTGNTAYDAHISPGWCSFNAGATVYPRIESGGASQVGQCELG